MLGLFGAMYLLVGLSVTAGYHRFFSHKTYECAPAVQLFYALFGAMAAQNSIATWSAGHRLHHQYADREWDPYSIRRGFWWAHIVWIFYFHESETYRDNVPDLMKNPIVRFQERFYHALLIVGGFGLPTLVGAAFGDPLAGLLWGGFLRLALLHHMTFLVNSAAHTFGEPTYDAKASARDNAVVAVLTLGEGYHSFHHRFPADYRNGIRWYHWDPSKWFIRLLHAVGLAQALRQTPDWRIEQARIAAAARE
jgi:stearoyl-CoA desaturase (delta-9 desaturase)